MDPEETVLASALPSGVPAQIGRYRVSRMLGRGGMGVVLLAEDPDLDREVAIKLIGAHDTVSLEARARFSREARSAARLSHPNIATLYDVGEVDDRPYLAMEYVRGESLADRLRHGSLSLERCMGMLRQLASAIAAAHAAGIVHRDLKPGNVMLSAAGSVKLLDFGLAHGGGSTTDALTKTGAMLGTPAYMSPEQVRGERVGPASDTFSLGVLAYEALTGKHPFLRDGVYPTLAAIATHEPDPIDTLRPDVPAVISTVVAQCLNKDASQRPAASAIVAVLEGDLVVSTTPRAPTEAAGRVAVLPLRNVTRSPDHEWVGAGIVDTLGHELRRSEGTTVADPGATMALQEEGMSPRDIGRRLGAEWVISGSFQVAGAQLRITSTVLHVPDGEETSCDRVDGALDAIFDLQDRLVDAVRAVVETRRRRTPSGRTLAAARPRDMRAYEAYARGLLELRTNSASGATNAEAHFRRALAIDPEYADAWAGFGAVLQIGFLTGQADTLAESKVCLEKAIGLDPEQALAHAWLCQAHTFSGEYERALAVGERAVELDPAHLDCWLFLGMTQLCMAWCLGEREWVARGHRSMAHALTLVPHYASIHHNLGALLLMLGDLPGAESHFRTAETLERGGSRHERWPGGDAYLGIVDLFRGDLDAAAPRLEGGAASLEGDDHAFAAWMIEALDLGLGELRLRRAELDAAHAAYTKVRDGARDEVPGMTHAKLRADLGLLRVGHARGENVAQALAELRTRALDPSLPRTWGYDLVAPYTYFDAAATFAEVGAKADALTFLAMAEAHGFLCPPRLDSTPAFDALRDDEAFVAIRGRMADYAPPPQL